MQARTHLFPTRSGGRLARGLSLRTTATLALLAAALGAAPAVAQDQPQTPQTSVVQSAPPSSEGAPVAQAPPSEAGPAPVAHGSASSAELSGAAPATGTAKAALPAAAKIAHDLSPMGMFLNADPVVKSVMILLALASVATWTILIMKMFGLLLAKRRLRRGVEAIRTSSSLTEAASRARKGVALGLLVEAEEEMGLSKGLPSEGIKERVAIALHRVEVSASRSMAVGTGMLATIGSIGPFVGLFGTVWGIMGSFIGIANSNTTNLAVVAPGIAEALLATGIGLVAAIPAVVIYNSLTRSIGGYRVMMGDAVALIMRHLSRDLDRHEFGTYAAAHPKPRMAAE